MRTFSVSLRFLVVSGLFALAYLAFSIWVISQFFEVYPENRKLRSELTAARQSLSEYKHKDQLLTQYEQLVQELRANQKDNSTKPADEASQPPVVDEEPPPTQETPATQPETPPEATTSVPSPEGLNTKEPVATTETTTLSPNGSEAQKNETTDSFQNTPKEEPAAATIPESIKLEPKTPLVIDVEGLVLASDSASKTVKFRYSLKNIHPDNKAVTGYLFIILENTTKAPATFVSYPNSEILDGNPVDFKKGTLFSIKHGKTVRGQIDEVEDAGDFKQAWVFAFSEEGELLMKKKLNSENG